MSYSLEFIWLHVYVWERTEAFFLAKRTHAWSILILIVSRKKERKEGRRLDTVLYFCVAGMSGTWRANWRDARERRTTRLGIYNIHTLHPDPVSWLYGNVVQRTTRRPDFYVPLGPKLIPHSSISGFVLSPSRKGTDKSKANQKTDGLDRWKRIVVRSLSNG